MICKCDGRTLILIRNRGHRGSDFILCGNAKVHSFKKYGEILNVKFRINEMNYHELPNEKALFARLGKTFDRESLLKLLNTKINEKKDPINEVEQSWE